MNYYATIIQAREAMNVLDSSMDTRLALCLDVASRFIDDYCARFFYTAQGQRTLDVIDPDEICIPDLISADSVAYDSGLNGTFAASATVDVDYTLEPRDFYPKSSIWTLSTASILPCRGRNTCRVVGTWGHGDGTASPWKASGITVTAATDTATSATASASGLAAGQTIRVESEDLFIEAASGTALTVVRGVNGSTTAAHSAKAASVAQYPPRIIAACLIIAQRVFEAADRNGIEEIQAGALKQRFKSAVAIGDDDRHMIGQYRRAVFA